MAAAGLGDNNGGGGSKSGGHLSTSSSLSSISARISIGGGAGGGGAAVTSTSTRRHHHPHHHIRPTTTTGITLAISRPPVLLEFTESSLFCGLAGDAIPKYVIAFTSISGRRDEPSIRDEPAVWYRYLVPLLKHAYQRLGLNPKERKSVVIFRGYDETSLPRSIEEALLAALIANLGVPAVNLQCSNLSMVPYGFPMLSHQLVVYIGLFEASCLVHASGENLPFTYQMVPLTARIPKLSDDMDDDQWFQWTFLNIQNPDSVILAISKSIEACPRTVRKDVIHNIIFCGTGLIKQPQIPLLVVKQFKTILKHAAILHQQEQQHLGRGERAMASYEQSQEEILGGAAADTLSSTSASSIQTVVPVPLKSLAGLESHVGLILNNSKIRPDLMTWMGATQWATYWNKQEPSLQKWKWHTAWPPKR